jgi:hypothetical protein
VPVIEIRPSAGSRAADRASTPMLRPSFRARPLGERRAQPARAGPGEYVVDSVGPSERRRRRAGATHRRCGAPRRYGPADVGEAYRDAGLIRGCPRPERPGLAPRPQRGRGAAPPRRIGRLDASAERQYADGRCRCRASTVCRRSGRTSGLGTRGRLQAGRKGRIVYLALVAELARRSSLPGLTTERTVGVNGTRISARLDGGESA